MPVRGPDPHNLRTIAKETAPLIENDRECPGCGYNLRGLRLGAACPECGVPTTAIGEIDEPLSHMPMRVILTFIRGCWVASICVLLMVALVIADRWDSIEEKYAAYGAATLAVIWLGAVIWLTPAFSIPQAVVRGFSNNSRVRRAARLFQFGWVAASFSLALSTTLTNPGNATALLLNLLYGGGIIAGLIGIVLLAIMMERLSEWARDDSAETLFNWSMWGVPIATLSLMFEISHPILAIISVFLWVTLACTFPYGLLSLSKSVTLTVLHALEHRDRLKRRDERTRQYHESVAKTIATSDVLQSSRKLKVESRKSK